MILKIVCIGDALSTVKELTSQENRGLSHNAVIDKLPLRNWHAHPIYQKKKLVRHNFKAPLGGQ